MQAKNPLTKTIAIILVVMVLIVIIDTIYKRLKPWIIGRRGEVMVALRLMLLCRNRYKVINDVLLKTPWGSSQIDHVIVSLYGIFVLETKTYEGTIYGGDNSEKGSDQTSMDIGGKSNGRSCGLKERHKLNYTIATRYGV